MRPRVRLLDLWNEGKADRFWYDDTRAALTHLFGASDGDRMLAYLAATSPRATLKSNVAKALRAFTDYKQGRPHGAHLPAHLGNLLRADRGEPLHGPKVSAFHRALLGDADAVVIDVWMLRLFGIEGNPTVAQFRAVESAVRRFARRVGEQPRRVQAALWIAYKRRVEGPRSIVASYQNLLDRPRIETTSAANAPTPCGT